MFRAGSIITSLSVVTAGSCGLVAGGWHGVLFATVFFSLMGALGMTISVMIAAALDSTRVVRSGWSPGPVVRTEVLERGAGQLAMTAPTSGALALRPDDRSSANGRSPTRSVL